MNVDLVSEPLRSPGASRAETIHRCLVESLAEVARSHLHCHAVGRAAKVIKEERLYLELGYATWEAYCLGQCPRRNDTINRYIKIAEGIEEAWLVPSAALRIGAVYEAAIAPVPVRKLLYQAALDGETAVLIQCARSAAEEAAAGEEASAALLVLQEGKGDGRKHRPPGTKKGRRSRDDPAQVPSRAVLARRLRSGLAAIVLHNDLWEKVPTDKQALPKEQQLALAQQARDAGKLLLALSEKLGLGPDQTSSPKGSGQSGTGGASPNRSEFFGVDEKKNHLNELDKNNQPPTLPPQKRPIAVKPTRLLPGQELLPVPYPQDIDEPTTVERVACGLFVLLTHAWAIARDLEANLRYLQELVPALFRLQLYNLRRKYNQELNPTLALLKEALPQAEKDLADLKAAEPGTDPDEFWPMKLDTDDPGPMFYLTMRVSSPEFIPWSKDPELSTKTTGWVLRLMALLERITTSLGLLRYRREEAKDPYDALLFAQLYKLLDESATDILYICFRAEEGTEGARQILQTIEEKRERIREKRIQEEKDLVIIGQRDKARSYVKLGREIGTGRQVAITLSRPLINLAIGDKGYGKTHQGMLIAEGARLDLPKLNRLDKGPLSTVIFSTEWRKAKGNRQLVRGFWPNPKEADLQILNDYYGFDVGRDSRWHAGTLLCLPGQAERLRHELADEVRRGLKIQDLKLHSLDLQNFGFSLLCNSGAEALGKDKPRYQGFLEQSIAELGNNLSVSALERDILAAKIDTRYKSLLLKQLQLIKLVVKDEERLGSLYEKGRDPGPIFVLLEGPHLGPDFVLPLQMVIVNALLQPGPDGKERPLWVIIEELTKLLANESVHKYLCEMIYEVRHHMFSVYGSGQMSLRFQPELITLPNVVTVFHMDNREEWRRLQQHRAPLAKVPFEEVYELDVGEALIFPQLCTDPDVERYGIRVDLRPTALDAGGETVEIG